MNEQVLKEEIAMLESNNRAMLEEMARTWDKHDKLKHNWNELKKFVKTEYYDGCIYSSTIIKKMEELEQESDVK
jgi:predicted nuclease with TOPRIM domain